MGKLKPDGDTEICPICGGNMGWSGTYWKKDEEENRIYEYAQPCKCRTGMIYGQHVKHYGAPEGFLNKTFKDFDDLDNPVLQMAKRTCLDYYQRFKDIRDTDDNSIILMGQSGSGKTHLSMAIVNNLMQHLNVSAVYFPFREKMTELKQSVTERGPYKTAMDKFKKAQLLMIDDLFYGKVSNADLNPLYELINYRYLNNLPMIISTEKTMNQLISYDEALATRIYERTYSHQIEIIGEEFNYRRRARE